MAFDGIRPNALIFLHFVLLVLSHSPEICYQNLPFNCTDRIFDTPVILHLDFYRINLKRFIFREKARLVL